MLPLSKYSLYLNENIAIEVKGLLASKGIRVIHTLDVGNMGKSDEFQLIYSTNNQCIMLTHNRRDFRKIHKAWNETGRKHNGILLIGCVGSNAIVERVANFLTNYQPSENPAFCEVPPEV